MPLKDPEIERVRERIHSAFKPPLRCITEVWDYKEKLRLRIVDADDQIIIQIPKIVIRDMSNPNRLQDFIKELRAQAQAKGFILT